MGFDLAQRLSLCTIGRATNKHFLCYTQSDRLVLDAKQSYSLDSNSNSNSRKL
jgi:hypothetical protein